MGRVNETTRDRNEDQNGGRDTCVESQRRIRQETGVHIHSEFGREWEEKSTDGGGGFGKDLWSRLCRGTTERRLDKGPNVL